MTGAQQPGTIASRHARATFRPWGERATKGKPLRAVGVKPTALRATFALHEERPHGVRLDLTAGLADPIAHAFNHSSAPLYARKTAVFS